MHTCVTSLHFLVTPSMAPLGRLLAYYVRENGEGVTDTLQFAVKPSFENQVWGVCVCIDCAPKAGIIPGGMHCEVSFSSLFKFPMLGFGGLFSK